VKIVCISDTHNQHAKVCLPAGDVLVHAGDATGRGTRSEMIAFLNWFGSRKGYQARIYVPGNHDFFAEEDYATTEILWVERGIKLLVDKRIAIDDVKFYGSPWVPNLTGWAYYGDHITLISRFARIPNDTDVLITHTPPFGTLADVGSYHIGCTELRDRIAELHLKVHIFGHIHDSYGQLSNGHISVNAAICDEQYRPVNAPIVIEVGRD